MYNHPRAVEVSHRTRCRETCRIVDELPNVATPWSPFEYQHPVSRCIWSSRTWTVLNADSPQSRCKYNWRFRDRETCTSSDKVLIVGSPRSHLRQSHRISRDKDPCISVTTVSSAVWPPSPQKSNRTRRGKQSCRSDCEVTCPDSVRPRQQRHQINRVRECVKLRVHHHVGFVTENVLRFTTPQCFLVYYKR